jgi:hypothetical protein
VERQEVLDAIVRKIEESGGTLVRSVKDLAAEVGVGPQRLYYLLKSFDQKGQLVTHSRGPKGLEIRLADGEGAPPKRARPARRARRAPPAAADGRIFCPWCGQAVQNGWRYCVHCGGELPQVAAPTE